MNEEKQLEHTVQTLNDQKNHLELLLNRHVCTRKVRAPITTTNPNTLNISRSEMKTIPITTLLDSNNNTGNGKRVTINVTNAQDLLAIAPLSRITTTTPTISTVDGSTSTVPMITIHIIPEVAHALLGSTSVDKSKLAELLQQANVNNSSSTATATTTTTTTISDSTFTNTSTNSTS